jgi:redox-sensitive bicupin YhaK (pirin superfamily)
MHTIITAISTLEGGGFPIRRPFPSSDLSDIDPFLLLDHLGPVEYAPNKAVGAPAHPHRGFETVTYLLEGSMTHEDSMGNRGVLHPGDVQWMTAGSGVIHSELPESTFLAQGGTLHGFQLWVNLPANLKMTAPKYQDIPRAKLPEVESPSKDRWVKVIAGQYEDVRAVIHTHTPMSFLHVRLQKGASFTFPIPKEYNSFAYVLHGEIEVAGCASSVKEGQLVRVPSGQQFDCTNPQTKGVSEFLFIGGAPIGEPIARYGPFVMNYPMEIRQAILDYQSGAMGTIPEEP